MEFNPIKNWEGLYEVSKEGCVRSTPRNGNGYKAKTMSKSIDSDGYEVFKARNKDKVRTLKVHRVVAEVYVPNPENKPQVNHKDGNKENNHYSNLEWVTNSENIRHAKANGLQCECPNRKPVCQMTNSGKVLNVFPSLKAAEEETGIGWTGISAVIRNKRKTAGGYYWKLFN